MSPATPTPHVENAQHETIVDAPHPESGLHFAVAETLEDVTDAWHLLYHVYRRAGFIPVNPYDLHTTHHAIGRHTTVVVSRIQGLTVGTISAIIDTERQLPLDSVYPEQLSALRQEGKKLMEVGLFGDRREDIERSFVAVLELMRFTFWYGFYNQVTDFICGIPPRRAKLYARAFGFEIIGEATSYASVENNPVVLLRSDTAKAMANRKRHKAIDYFMDHPLPPETFEKRFGFEEGQYKGTLLEKYLTECIAHK